MNANITDAPAVNDMLAEEGFMMTGVPGAWRSDWEHADGVIRASYSRAVHGRVLEITEVQRTWTEEEYNRSPAKVELTGDVSLVQARGVIRLFTGWTE